MTRISFKNGWSAEFDDDGDAIPGTGRGSGNGIDRAVEVDGGKDSLFWWSFDDFKAKLPVIRIENDRELRLEKPYTRIWTIPDRRGCKIELEELTTDGRWIVTSQWD